MFLKEKIISFNRVQNLKNWQCMTHWPVFAPCESSWDHCQLILFCPHSPPHPGWIKMPQEGRNPEISFGLLTRFPDLEKKGKRGSYGAVVASSLFCCIYLDFLALSLLLSPSPSIPPPSLPVSGERNSTKTDFFKKNNLCKIITIYCLFQFSENKGVFHEKKDEIRATQHGWWW